MTDYNSAHTGAVIDAAVVKAAKLPTIAGGDASKSLKVKSDESGFEAVDEYSNSEIVSLIAAHLIDEDDFSSDSAVLPPSQQSVKAYIASQVAAAAVLPSGVITMWSGSIANIPSGWYICDGNNGTPNLLSKFVVGVASAVTEPGTTGGASSHAHSDTLAVDNHTLLDAEIPKHTHPITGGVYQEFGGNGDLEGVDVAAGTFNTGEQATGDGAHNHALSGSVSSESTLPPYYAVAYIMKG